MSALEKYLWVFCFTLCHFLVPAELFAQGETDRVSISSSGIEGDDFSNTPATSRYGTHVAFESRAGNLVTGDTNGLEDIFVRDRLKGITKRSSVDSAGVQGNSRSENPSISACGRFVAFESWANNLVAGDSNKTADIFVRDHHAGLTERVSVNSAGEEADGGGLAPHISADGRYVAFHSAATNLVFGDTNKLMDVFVHDRLLGLTVRVSVDSSGVQGNSNSMEPSISADGRYVAFQSWADNLVPGDTNYECDVFVHDLDTGLTVRASVDSAGVEADNWSKYPGISGNGRYVAFHSDALNLVPGDSGWFDIFVHDLQTGQTVRASVTPQGGQAHGDSLYATLSHDGRYVAFHSMAGSLDPKDTNGHSDIFIRDMQTGVTSIASVDSMGVVANYGSDYWSSISPDGNHVAFSTYADNLVPGDNNQKTDVFLHTPKLRFSVDTHSLPEAGGTVNFYLNANANNAGRSYFILGSITGTNPGTPLPGGLAILPLNWDIFTNMVINLANTSVFANFMGALDGAGKATAQMNVGALPPGTAGLWMYFAFGLMGPYDFVSNPMAVQVVP